MTVSIGNVGVATGTGNVNILVLPADEDRKYARITNLQAVPTFLSIGTSALINNGILLNTIGDYYEINVNKFNTTFVRASGTGNSVLLAYQAY